jgi:hypothetical protein
LVSFDVGDFTVVFKDEIFALPGTIKRLGDFI